MQHLLLSLLASMLLLTACAGDPVGLGSQVVVARVGSEYLKLRAGPGLGYRVVLGLPEGTALTRYDCVTEVGQLWCKVSLPDAPRMTGYVSADYLSEH